MQSLDKKIEDICRWSAEQANHGNDNDWFQEAEQIAVNSARTAIYKFLGIEQFDGKKFICEDEPNKHPLPDKIVSNI